MTDHPFYHPHARVDWTLYQPFFKCAQRLGRDLQKRRGNARVLMLLVSDSKRLRDVAAQTLGQQLVMLRNVSISHIRIGRHVSNATEGFLAAATEHWLFGLCSGFVVTAGSGYGRSASLVRAAPGWEISRAARPVIPVVPGRHLASTCLLGDSRAVEFPPAWERLAWACDECQCLRPGTTGPPGVYRRSCMSGNSTARADADLAGLRCFRR